MIFWQGHTVSPLHVFSSTPLFQSYLHNCMIDDDLSDSETQHMVALQGFLSPSGQPHFTSRIEWTKINGVWHCCSRHAYLPGHSHLCYVLNTEWLILSFGTAICSGSKVCRCSPHSKSRSKPDASTPVTSRRRPLSKILKDQHAVTDKLKHGAKPLLQSPIQQAEQADAPRTDAYIVTQQTPSKALAEVCSKRLPDHHQ